MTKIQLTKRNLNLAIEKWLSKSKKPKLSLANWETIKGGAKTRLLSEQVDSILYKY